MCVPLQLPMPSSLSRCAMAQVGLHATSTNKCQRYELRLHIPEYAEHVSQLYRSWESTCMSALDTQLPPALGHSGNTSTTRCYQSHGPREDDGFRVATSICTLECPSNHRSRQSCEGERCETHSEIGPNKTHIWRYACNRGREQTLERSAC